MNKNLLSKCIFYILLVISLNANSSELVYSAPCSKTDDNIYTCILTVDKLADDLAMTYIIVKKDSFLSPVYVEYIPKNVCLSKFGNVYTSKNAEKTNVEKNFVDFRHDETTVGSQITKQACIFI